MSEDNKDNIVKQGFIVEGLKGERSSDVIKMQAMKVDGVKKVEFHYSRRVGYVTFDESKTDIDQILSKIEDRGFKAFILDEDKADTENDAQDNATCDACDDVDAGDDSEVVEHVKAGAVSSETSEKKSALIKKAFTAKGTTCNSCAEIIKRQAMKIHGVKEAHFDYPTETGFVVYDTRKTNMHEILAQIEKKGYSASVIDNNDARANSKKSNNTLGWVFGIIGIVVVIYFILKFVGNIPLPQISTGMSYGLLFLVGLLTGFHCIAMCGGFVVSYTARDAQEGRKSHKSHLLYGLGKTISYTIIGAIFGLVGSIIAFTPTLRGVIGVLSGLFLVLFGFKMLNIFPVLRKIQFRAPKFINKFVGKESSKTSKSSPRPLVIGLLNGLMIACGPLQAIYIMAAGTGSMIEGAKLLFVFALGTLPVMLGFGYFASYISSKMTQKILKISAVLVIILGLMLLNHGLVLTGSGFDFNSVVSSIGTPGNVKVPTSTVTSGSTPGTVLNDGSAVLKDGYQEIRMTVDSAGFTPNKFVLKKGVPVHWIINGKQLTSCNRAIQVPAYNLKFDVKQGEQTINFTPDTAGTIRWSCWMGMIPGTFVVVDNIDLNNSAAVQTQLNSVPAQKAGSCNMGAGGGGCGCGG